MRMRMRWMAGLVGASAVILATAATLAQRPMSPAPTPLNSVETKRWRSSNDPLVLEVNGPTSELAGPVDPMEVVEAFLDRNRKEADESIRALNEEAEALRARLAKVEAALGRWQSIAGALQVEVREAPAPPGPEPAAAQLDPIEPPPALAPAPVEEAKPELPPDSPLPPTLPPSDPALAPPPEAPGPA
ncbi:hypothetical protein P12x_002985 [Tundrisphaera lichenicola]|uniref:hypothetical protein n=1 Tax=Tundrisphaera lichenicola TaxID=2029860 RepID=UPI003EC12FD6